MLRTSLTGSSMQTTTVKVGCRAFHSVAIKELLLDYFPRALFRDVEVEIIGEKGDVLVVASLSLHYGCVAWAEEAIKGWGEEIFDLIIKVDPDAQVYTNIEVKSLPRKFGKEEGK